MSLELLSCRPEFIRAELERVITRQLAWHNSSLMVAARERWRAEWLAKPWYQRAWVVSRSRFNAFRLLLGEIIAGEKFHE